MAQTQEYEDSLGSAYSPSESVGGKVLVAAVLGVVVTMGAAGGVGVAAGESLGPLLSALAAGGVGSVVLVVALATVGRSTVGDLRSLVQTAEEIADGDYEADVEVDRGDEVGLLADQVEEMRDSLDTRSSDLETLNRRITNVVRDQVDVMNECGEGNLTLRMETGTGIPQFDALAEDFNRMMDDTEAAVANSKQFSQAVAVAANETTANLREVRNQIEDVIAATEAISEGVATQDQRFAETAAEMSDLSATIEEVAASADELTEQSRETVKTTERGREAAEDAIDALDTIQTETDEAAEAVEELEDEMDKIGEVVELIREIADETNLLAVNAQIEAAHAGEVGEGFGIVADKIKSLADDTATAAETIERSLRDIETTTGRTTQRMEKTRRSVERGTSTIEEALGALDEINTVVEETNVSVQQINDATKDQARTAEDVVQMIDEVAEISEKTADQAEEVVDITKQQNASVTQVGRSVETLAEQAANLNDSLAQFEVSEETAPQRTVNAD